jgi:hypothetical protein
MFPMDKSRRRLFCPCVVAAVCGLIAAAITFVPAQAAAAEDGRLTIAVTEPNSKTPLPCRIHLKDPAGKPVEAGSLPFWRDHFVCPGTVELNLPVGAYAYEIERGPEYVRAVGRIEVKESGTTAKVTLERLINMPAEGWWPGELHVHRPVADIELLMQAEDLYVAPVITWWNNRNLWANPAAPPDRLLHVFDGKRTYHVMAGEDEREGGALLYFNLPQPLPIAGAEREFPSPMKFLAEARRETNVWVDIEKPFWWDAPVWLASGQVDSIGIANNHMWRGKMYQSTARTTDEAWGKTRDMERLPRPLGNGYWSQEIYYHALNCGLRLPPSAGSASGVLPNPVGYNRVYVHTGDDFSYDRWFNGLYAGRCIVTNGPLLRVEANGQLSGHVFQAAAGESVAVELKAKLTSRDPIRAIEVIQNGRVVRTVSFDDWKRTGSLGSLDFPTSGWFLVRAMVDDPRTFCFASTAPWYVEVGSDKRRISKQSAQFFVDWVVERQARVKIDDEAKREEVLAHHRSAEKFWRDLAAKANAE